MNSIRSRGFSALNLNQYCQENYPEVVGGCTLEIPQEKQYVLRCLIKEAFGDFNIPEEMLWCKPIIDEAVRYQESMGLKQPFCYITIRSGIVESVTDDEWHVDGFSQTITHLPEQNYIWTDSKPTEFTIQGINFPDDFNSQIHNIHLFIQDSLKPDTTIESCKEKVLYCMDPYVIHRRPPITSSLKRTFVRISFTPIEIIDCNNTQNPLLPRNYKRDGVKGFRDTLKRYSI